MYGNHYLTSRMFFSLCFDIKNKLFESEDKARYVSIPQLYKVKQPIDYKKCVEDQIPVVEWFEYIY
jgi:hypothetical protein